MPTFIDLEAVQCASGKGKRGQTASLRWFEQRSAFSDLREADASLRVRDAARRWLHLRSVS
jgi:hypothetical protein